MLLPSPAQFSHSAAVPLTFHPLHPALHPCMLIHIPPPTPVRGLCFIVVQYLAGKPPSAQEAGVRLPVSAGQTGMARKRGLEEGIWCTNEHCQDWEAVFFFLLLFLLKSCGGEADKKTVHNQSLPLVHLAPRLKHTAQMSRFFLMRQRQEINNGYLWCSQACFLHRGENIKIERQKTHFFKHQTLPWFQPL